MSRTALTLATTARTLASSPDFVNHSHPCVDGHARIHLEAEFALLVAVEPIRKRLLKLGIATSVKTEYKEWLAKQVS